MNLDYHIYSEELIFVSFLWVTQGSILIIVLCSFMELDSD